MHTCPHVAGGPLSADVAAANHRLHACTIDMLCMHATAGFSAILLLPANAVEMIMPPPKT